MSRLAMSGAAIALAASAAGIVIPSLRALAGAHGAGVGITGVLVAAHVIGGALGAALAPALARAVGVRRMTTLALLASAALLATVSALPTLGALIAARLFDGAFHLLGITSLFAAGVGGSRERRGREAAVLGMILVLAIGAGIAAGGRLEPQGAFAAAAALTGAAMILGRVALRDVRSSGERPVVRAAQVVAPPALIAGCERLAFGVLTVATPILLGPRRGGMVLGTLMTASVVALPFARRLASRWGAEVLARRAAVVLVVALGVAWSIGLGGAAIPWAILAGFAAGGLYGAAIAMVAAHAIVDQRLAAMAAVHAAGNAGHAMGALAAGLLLSI